MVPTIVIVVAIPTRTAAIVVPVIVAVAVVTGTMVAPVTRMRAVTTGETKQRDPGNGGEQKCSHAQVSKAKERLRLSPLDTPAS